ncbi:MAG: ExbD/TolR family protein [Persicimonas sp.]
MRNRFKNKDEQQIDLSPLIDMVFILLIFFMVSTTFVKDMELDLERPGAKSAESASTEALRVYVDENSSIYVDDSPVKPWMLQSRVRQLIGEGDGQVLVSVDRGVSSEKLIEVVDECRLAGAEQVAVATEQEE